MSKRIIEISSSGYYLSIKLEQLRLEREGNLVDSIPVDDLAALVIDHPQTLITQPCLRKLTAASVMVIVCDDKHHPSGMLLPLQTHSTQAERFRAQSEMSKPLQKRLWQQLIKQKIRLQAKVLKDLKDNDAGLSKLAGRVRSGDPDNIEAQAARRYWNRLYSSNFKRDRDASDCNQWLNYGYAILRALVTRSLCATGLHPCLGIHHHNRYNPFCLADDVIEPYRPYIDIKVWELTQDNPDESELGKETRKQLLSIVRQPLCIAGDQVTFQGAIQRTAQSFSQVVMQQANQLALPDL